MEHIFSFYSNFIAEMSQPCFFMWLEERSQNCKGKEWFLPKSAQVYGWHNGQHWQVCFFGGKSFETKSFAEEEKEKDFKGKRAVQKNRFANLILILKTTEIHWIYWGYQLFFLCSSQVVNWKERSCFLNKFSQRRSAFNLPIFYKKMMPSGLWRRMKSDFHLILEIVVAILLLECIVQLATPNQESTNFIGPNLLGILGNIVIRSLSVVYRSLPV